MNDKESTDFIRELGLTEALSIGLGTMIGAGIFVLSAVAAQRAGPAASLSYVAAGLVCLPIAMAVSELATGMPRAGGSYHLISRSLGPLAGAIVGPGNWLGLVFATGFYLIGFAQYLAYFLPVPIWVSSVGAGLCFIFLNYRGAKLSGRVQKYIVVVLVLILSLFVGRGIFSVDPKLHNPYVPSGWEAVIANLGLIIVSFTGFEKISTISEEIKKPGRNLPLAIVGSVVIATILYGSILHVATGILSYNVIADYQAPLVEAAGRFMSKMGVIGMSIAALLATASSANAAIMASARINFALSRDQILPSWFSTIHPRFLTPSRSVIATGGLAILLALSGAAARLAEISSALFMVSYALLSLGILVIRRARPVWYRPAYRMPFFPWLPLLGGILAIAVIGTMDHGSQIIGFVFVGLSLGWYGLWGRHRTSVKGALIPWLRREQPLEALIANVEQLTEANRHEILLPVANPATAKSLMTIAVALAQGQPGTEVAALKIVPVPVNIPLTIAQDYLQKEQVGWRSILRRVAKHGSGAGIRVKMLLHAAHGIASGIVAVAESRPNTRLILLGWRGPLTLDRIRKSIDKEIIRKAPCDVAILLDRQLKEVRRILVPAAGGPHARLGLRLAYDLAKGEDAELVVLRVVLREKDLDVEAEEAAVKMLIKNELGAVNNRIFGRVVQSATVVGGILSEVQKGYDMLIIGSSEEWFWRNWLFGAIPDRVAGRAPCSVLLVRKHEPAPLSWIRRNARKHK